MIDGQSVNQVSFTLTEVLGWLRELSIIGAIIGISWKLRGAWDDAGQFLERVSRHMTMMEQFAQTVMMNHLKHIEDALDKIASSDRDRETRESK